MLRMPEKAEERMKVLQPFYFKFKKKNKKKNTYSLK